MNEFRTRGGCDASGVPSGIAGGVPSGIAGGVPSGIAGGVPSGIAGEIGGTGRGFISGAAGSGLLRGGGTPHASLAVFDPIHTQVRIEQKSIRYRPTEKLFQAFVGILAGAERRVEVNAQLREDPALQTAFGTNGCAEQSVIQQTLDACTDRTVQEMHGAIDTIYQKESRGYRHDYRADFQLLDVDMSGKPCGKKAECATKGYFPEDRNRRGRQLGRVTASRYGEIVVDRLYPGTVQLAAALPSLVAAAETTLELDRDAEKRKRTILRVDGGGGTLDDINWALEQGYAYHGKDYSPARAEKLAATVVRWEDDSKVRGRQFGFVPQSPSDYVRPVTRIAVRFLKKKGQWRTAVIVSALSEVEVLQQVGRPAEDASDPKAVLGAHVHFYDQRGGGVESTFKEDKQGIGLTKRNKKRFAAQQMLTQLEALAHNSLIWAKAWLAEKAPTLAGYGIFRLMRDVLPISGRIEVADDGRVRRIVLNQTSRLARLLFVAFLSLLDPLTSLSLGQT